MTARFSGSSRATTRRSIPTPKSKPSSTKKPIHRIESKTNQTISRVVGSMSVGQREVVLGRVLFLAVGPVPGLLEEQPSGEVREHAVQQRVGDERQPDLPARDRRRIG